SQRGVRIAQGVAAQSAGPARAGSPRHAEIARLTALATASFDKQDYAAATDLLMQILRLDPDSPPAHGNLAVALWRTKHPARAEALCRRAPPPHPQHVAAHPPPPPLPPQPRAPR